MQRKDIKAGAELYYSRNRDPYGYGYGCKAVVVDAGYWTERSDWEMRRNPGLGLHVQVDPGRVGRSAGVIVDLHEKFGGSDDVHVRRTIVKPGQLHGPYVETLAAIEKASAERAEATRVAGKARDEREARIAAILARFNAIGLVASGNDERVYVSPDVAEKLLAAYEKMGES